MSEDVYKRIFSSNLRYYMDLNHKSQADIINDLGYDKSAVSTWCNGTRLPRMDKVDALAKYLGIYRSDLIEERVPSVVSRPIQTDLTRHELDIVNAYRSASSDTRAAVCAVLGIKGDPAQLTGESSAV